MDELKMEGMDRGNPAINGCVWLDIWVIEHALDILCIDRQIDQAHNKNADRA